MTQPGSSVVPADQWAEMSSGLEDIEASDLRMPRITIEKDDGVFKDNMSGETFAYMTAVPLGVIKQRVLWQPTMGEETLNPMCKSPDSKQGFPTISGKKEELFPWEASGFSPGDFPLNPEGRAVVPCTSCRLAQWKSHPDGKKAWCSEQWTIPILYGPEDDTPQITALLTAQRSSLAPAKGYFAGLFQRKVPAFSSYAIIGLNPMMRGKNKYFIPTWKLKGATPEDEWPVYSQSYQVIREYVQQPPRSGEEVNAQSVAGSNVVQGSFIQTPTWTPGQPLVSEADIATLQAQKQTQMQSPIMQQQSVPFVQGPAPTAYVPPVNTTSRDADDDLPF